MGLKGKDFVVVCSDTVAAQSIIRMKADENKIVEIDDRKLFALSGERKLIRLMMWKVFQLRSGKFARQ